MPRPILILGGYGNFGKRIAERLTYHGLPVIIAGRNLEKAQAFARTLPAGLARPVALDAQKDLKPALATLKPKVVINTCGPFQNADYHVAQSCIEASIHYVDLADGRRFVTEITGLDDKAKANDTLIISGASTVPGLSSAVLRKYAPDFSEIDTLSFGISPGQKAERGLATTKGIMSYVGRPLRPAPGQTSRRYGWQDIYRQNYPELGKRWMANCDIPDLDLLPKAYNIKNIRFSAGLELGFLHLGLYALSWLIRLGLPIPLEKWAAPFLAVSNIFNRLGSANGGMHILMKGHGFDGKPLKRSWYIIAKNGHGPYIPTVPAILLAKQLATDALDTRGAMPCVSLVRLDDYLEELSTLDIEVFTLSTHAS